MIKPIPPKSKVLIAWMILVAGTLTATRFPANKTASSFMASETSSLTCFTQDDGTLPAVVPPGFSDKPLDGSSVHVFSESATIDHGKENQEIFSDESIPRDRFVDSSLSLNETVLDDENRQYKPFQVERSIEYCPDYQGFHSSRPTPPQIVPASIGSENSVAPVMRSHSLSQHNSSSLAVNHTRTIAPVTHRVHYRDQLQVQSVSQNIVTAQGEAIVMPADSDSKP